MQCNAACGAEQSVCLGMTNIREQEAIDALIQGFFSAFDNRCGRMVNYEDIVAYFASKAVIAKYSNARHELYSPEEFAKPRVALLASGDLTDFHEWEESASTQIVGDMASRTSRYAKSGFHLGAIYAGKGTKFFQLGRFDAGWRIVALSWMDDEASA